MTLIYVMDPMCSWCYAFQPQLKELLSRLKPGIKVLCYMGGLAPDSDEPMPKELQQGIQQTWHTIEERTGTPFNHEFWTLCHPRRSTYPACRAVISAELLESGAGMKMVEAIQQGYYQEARNPSNLDTLISFAEQTGLNREEFVRQLQSQETEDILMDDLSYCQQYNVTGFPFLALKSKGSIEPICIGYCDQPTLLARASSIDLI